MDVERLLVRASVPLFLSNGMTTGKARKEILAALAEAMQNGYFQQVAGSRK
jgi:hypothetical protein